MSALKTGEPKKSHFPPRVSASWETLLSDCVIWQMEVEKVQLCRWQFFTACKNLLQLRLKQFIKLFLNLKKSTITKVVTAL